MLMCHSKAVFRRTKHEGRAPGLTDIMIVQLMAREKRCCEGVVKSRLRKTYLISLKHLLDTSVELPTTC